jgi:hypothetical protein
MADHILMLENGQIVEEGSHAEIGGWEDDWSGVRLRFRAFLGDE